MPRSQSSSSSSDDDDDDWSEEESLPSFETDIQSLARLTTSGGSGSNSVTAGPVIGITIGATSMSVAMFRNRRICIIPGEKGCRITPAVIAFTPTGRLIGQEAVDQWPTNAANTIRGATRMIDKKLNDLRSIFPYNNFICDNSVPFIEVQQEGEMEKFTAEDLTVFMIEKMKDIVQQHSGITVTDAVIAVPAHMSQNQRKVIVSAAESAGLHVQLIDQAIAACIAHRLDKRDYVQNMLILHCGGETTSATVIRKINGKMVMKKTAINHKTGGRHFDDQLFRKCRDKFMVDYKINLNDSVKNSARLREAVIKAKITLSSLDEALISIAALHRGKDFSIRITRTELEEWCSALFDSLSAAVTDALKQSDVNKQMIDRVVLIGGSARIPKIKKLMEEMFAKEKIVRSDDFTADQAVVYGCVFHALRSNGKTKKSQKKKRKRSYEDDDSDCSFEAEDRSASEQRVRDQRTTARKGSEAVIGIDLGTTFSCVGVSHNGKVIIIPNEQGNKITPSCVAFTSRGRLIGDPAKDHAAIDPKNTVFEIKRLMGMKYDDLAIQDDIKNWLFSVVDDNSKPLIEVDFQNQKKRFCAEEISGFILSKLKNMAEEYTKTKITKAVITVPAYFNDFQRVATKTAARIAGLTDVRIIAEPTAAAIAYGLDHAEGVLHSILVFDLGGGTFDVSVLVIEDQEIEVIATAGDTHLGGKDFDSLLVDHFCKKILLKHGQDISSDVKAVYRLRLECEKAKIRLSSFETAEIEIDCLFGDTDFKESITRAEFEFMCGNLFLKTLVHLGRVLEDAKFSADRIDDVVLVGGSTRIPYIRNLVSMFFSGKKIRQDIHPDEAVAIGAVLRSAMLFGSTTELSGVQIHDVTPLSLGMKVIGDVMSTVIPRNTPIPVEIQHIFMTVEDYQRSIDIQVFQGERTLVRDNICLGQFELNGIPANLRGVCDLMITFKLDEDGVLEVKAQPKPGARVQKMRIKDPCNLPESEMERMIAAAEEMQDHDREEQERIEVRNRFYYECYDHRFDEKIGEKCEEMLEWLRDTPDADKEILQKKLDYLNDDLLRDTGED